MRRLRRAFQHLRFDFQRNFRGLPAILRLFFCPLTFFILFTLAAITWMLILNDSSVLTWITARRDIALEPIARWFSYWGDYPTGSVTIALTLWLVGYLWRKVSWRRAAIACLIAATITGIISVSTRCTLGRPRPGARVADGLYGPSVSYNYQAFPSGHSATSWGTATALVITAPPIGIPVACGAAAVVWSRLYLERHHPSDVFAGSWIGVLGGLIVGLASRYHHRKPIDLTQSQTASMADEMDIPMEESSVRSVPLLETTELYVPAPVLVTSSREPSKIPQDFA